MSGYVEGFIERLAEQQEKSQTARNRIADLLDENSFVETGAFVSQRLTAFSLQQNSVPADGVICGHGLIDGRLVFVYSQDNEALGGSVGEMHAKKIETVYENALKMGAPVIGIIDSKGVRLSENIDALNSLGTVFSAMSRASGVVPQISIILGGCMGGMSFVPALSDFVFMTEKDSLLFMSSPNAIKSDMGKRPSYEELGGGASHAVNSGLVSCTEKDEVALFSKVRELFGYMPSNNMDEGVIMLLEQAAAGEYGSLDQMCEDSDINAKEIIKAISDGGRFFEITPKYANGIITGFSRVNGITAGIVSADGQLCNKCMAKAASFISFCDSFNIPLVSFTNATGFTPSVTEEHNGIIKNGAKLMHAFCAATVPKINIITGSAYGSAYIVMNSKHIGADMVFAWPGAKISVMDAEAAVNVMLSDEIKSSDDSIEFRDAKIKEYEETQASPYAAAARGYVDSVIKPASTRDVISSSLETLYSKRVIAPSRKHSSVF